MTIFVGGVHAVGKTFLLQPVCQELGIRHATASQLIREQRGFQSWTSSKQVDDIDENQTALVAAVARVEQDSKSIVLDGHFALRRDINVHEPISPQTFTQLRIRGSILFDAASEVIVNRLLQRGDTSWSAAEVDDLRRMERRHAETVCRELSVPILYLYMPSAGEVRDAVAQLLT